MKQDLFEIIMILDESGSMESCKRDTIGGVNEFLNAQKKIKGEVNFTLVKFSDYYKVVNDAIPLERVVYLNETNYTPSFSTALLDAVGKTIDDAGKRLAAVPEEKRPERILIVIITDGYENASKIFSQKQIFDMVSHQKSKYNWEFLFLGADIDAWGKEIGVSYNVNIEKGEMPKSFKSLSHYVLKSRISNIFDDPSESFNLSEDQLDKKLNRFFEDNNVD